METIEQMHARLAKKEADRKAEISRVGARLDQEGKERKAAAEKAKAEQDAKRDQEFQRQRQEQFDREYKLPAMQAYLATGGTKQEFETIWQESLREEMRQEVVRAELDKRRKIAQGHRGKCAPCSSQLPGSAFSFSAGEWFVRGCPPFSSWLNSFLNQNRPGCDRVKAVGPACL
jgi:hypothetical protein